MRRDSRYKYLINVNPGHLEVHDLDNEHTGFLACQIDEIIKAGHARYLVNVNDETDLITWLNNNTGYDVCN